jgi:MFS family permease
MTDTVKKANPDWIIVALLWGAFFLNQADRQVYNVVLPLIQADLKLSSASMGLIATLFTVAYGLFVPFAGIVGDSFSRRNVVVLSLIVFSLGTLTTAFASSFIVLLLCRSLATGAGEAFYSPAASALIGETHVDTRGRALAVHQTANYTGIVLGSLFTGWIAERFGWRASFLSYGICGLVWAGIIVYATRKRVVERRVIIPISDQLARLAETARYIGRQPILLAQFFAFGGLVFGMTGFLTWTPTLLHEKFGLSITDAGFSAVFYHHLLAYVSLIGASVLTDKWIGRLPRIRLLSMAIGMMLCAPALFLAASANGLWTMYIGFALYGLFRGVYDAGLYAAIFDTVDDARRSTVIGLLIATAFMIGAVSPWLMGMLKAQYGLETGLTIIGVVQVITGGILALVTLVFRPSSAQ